MTISVTGPDGSSFSFPDGMSETDISSAMDSHYGAAKAEPKDVNPLVDLAKAAPVGVAQGIIGLPGMGGDLQQLAKAGVDKVAEKTGLSGSDPLGWLAGKFEENFPNAAKFIKESNAKSANAPIRQISSGDMPGEIKLPTSSDIQGQVEKVTGPFYQAQTPLGKIGQTAGQVLPALATGGGSVAGLAGKAIGAGLGAEGAGQAADALKGYLPDAAAPYAEPVARAIGTGAGVFAPSAVRRAITPLPMQADQAAAVAALRAKDPNFPMTAGQMAESPTVMALEGRAPRFDAMPEKQSEAFTRGTMQEMGVDGLATPKNIAKGGAIGDRIGAIRRGNEINPTEFPQLNKDIDGIVKKYTGTVGKDDAALLADIQKNIRMGASNNLNVASMPGARYDYLRQKLQTAIDKAGTGTESKALSDVRSKLDEAFHRSIPTDQSAELKKLEGQYANYKVLSNKKVTGADTITPKELSAAVAKGFGNAGVNENRGTLAPYARDAARVMKELPEREPATVGGPLARVVGSAVGGVLGGGAGAFTGHGALDPAIVGAILGGGHGGLGDLVEVLKNGVGRVAARPRVQKYLKNQQFLPGPNSTADKSTLLRLLMSPPVEQLTGQPQ